MEEYVKYNRYNLLNIKSKSKMLWLMTIIVCLSLVIASIFIKTYENYSTLASFASEDKKLNIDVEIDNVSKLINSKYVNINNNKYQFTIDNISEIKYDDYLKINYQTVKISVNKNFIDNEVVKLNFCYDKQRIIRKILNIF